MNPKDSFPTAFRAMNLGTLQADLQRVSERMVNCMEQTQEAQAGVVQGCAAAWQDAQSMAA